MTRPQTLFDEGGAAAVEFALVSVVFIPLLLGICYIGIMLFNRVSLDWAVEKAARVAEVNPSASASDIAAAVNSYLSSEGLPHATVVYSTVLSAGVTIATINAQYSQTYYLPMVSTFHMNFASNLSVPLTS